jgi:FixJ family two-component response regulator
MADPALKAPASTVDHQGRQAAWFPPITPKERRVMDARTTPDRNSVIAARKDIETSTVEVKDEMLTELLCRMYPLRISQDS